MGTSIESGKRESSRKWGFIVIDQIGWEVGKLEYV